MEDFYRHWMILWEFIMVDVFILVASIGSSSLTTSFTPDPGLQEDGGKPAKRPKIEGQCISWSNYPQFYVLVG